MRTRLFLQIYLGFVAIALVFSLAWVAAHWLSAGERVAPPFVKAFIDLLLVGTASEKAPSVSFVLEGIHPHDIGTILDQEGVAVRAGHHCAQPVMEHFRVPSTVRVSLSFYNTEADIDALMRGLDRVNEVFGR